MRFLVQLRQVLSWKLLSCILVFAGVQGLAISGLMAATPNPTALYYYVLSTTSGTTVPDLLCVARPFLFP